MRFDRVRIERLAHIEAPQAVPSAALEDDLAPVYERLGIPESCIESLTGILARRFWEPERDVASGAVLAAEQCLAGIDRGTVGALVSASVSKDYLEPSVAALVHGDLGLPSSALNFDLSNACLGFVSAMGVVGRLLEDGVIERALVVASESSRNVVLSTLARLKEPAATLDDYKSFLPTLTLGSGAVAMLLARDDVTGSPRRFDGVVALAGTEHNRICMGTYDWMRTDAPKLMSEGVALARRVWALAEETFGWHVDELAQLICHQVGAAHLATLCRALALPVEKAFKTYPEFGNMGSAALPFTLAKADQAGVLGPGDRVALMGIGSGLNCSMAQVTW